MTPTLPATTACQKDSPNPRTQAPQDSPRTEMVGREPGHEEIARPPLAIGLGDDVKTGVLDAGGGGATAGALLMGDRPQCRYRDALE